MSEALVIPEDLREMYAVAVTHRHNYGSKPKYGSGTVEVLIVVDLLRKRQGKKSLRVFGREIGVTAAYLSDVFRGNREPGPTILTLLGVRRTKTTETTYEKGKG